MTTPHKHAALIKQWVDDTSQQLWYFEPTVHPTEWLEFKFGSSSPAWRENCHYAIGPRPTHPPRKMCILAGVDFPMPEMATPNRDVRVFFAHAAGTSHETWLGFATDFSRLNAGLMHLSAEAAAQHSRALLAANKQAIEAAK